MRHVLFTLLFLLLSVGSANAVGGFDDTFHVWISDLCDDNFDTPHTGADHNADPEDVSTWSTSATAITYIPHLSKPDQTSGSPDGWCDTIPAAIALSTFTVTAGQSIFLLYIPISAVGSYILIRVTEAEAEFEISASIPLIPGEDVVVFSNDVPEAPGIYSYYWGPQNAVVIDDIPPGNRMDSLEGVSIRPFVANPELRLRLTFPTAGDYSFSIVSETVAQPNNRR